MEFRFPHPFENIGDAVKDALNPDTDADGSLVGQLMNENNRAIEDYLNVVVSGNVVTSSGSHGPGVDTSHTFSFSFGSGVWVAQINSVAETDATAGFFGVSPSGGATPGTKGPLPLSSTGDASDITTVIVDGGDLDVLLAVANLTGGTSFTFEIDVTATRVS